jgi:Na+-translocating ferredoxin:NAD+ oxidoreductase RnfG subunit
MNRSLRTFQVASLAALFLATAGRASAEEVYWTPKALLKDFFKTSDKVGYLTLETKPHAAALKARLGALPPKDKYVVFVARTGDRVDGYAVIDEERGQHEPITFAVKLSPAGAVERMEVMVYREGYGAEIREPRFRRQFEGKVERDALKVGDDLVAISGATISSKAMAIGVRRAVALVSVLRAENTVAAAR